MNIILRKLNYTPKLTFFLFLLIASLIGVRGRGQILWSNTGASTAWYTNTNWTPNTSSAQWITTNLAQFQNAGTATTAGINMGTAPLSIGAIEVTSARTRVLTIGNSSGTTGTLTLNGITVNTIPNTILFNSSAFTLTLQDNETGTGKTMNIALANNTANVVNVAGAGNIIVASNIIGLSKNLTFNSTSSGDLRLSSATQNTFTGGITANGSSGATGKFRFDATTAFPTSGNIAVTNYGRLSFNVAGTYGVSGQTMTFTPTQIATGSLENAVSNIATVFPGSVVLAADTRIEPAGATGSITLSGAASGSGTLIKQASGNLILTGSNTLTGNTQIGNGVLTVNSGSSMGTGNLTLAQTSTNNTSVILNNASQSIGNLASTFTATTGTQTQVLTLNGTALTINQASNTTYGAGAVSTLSSTITGTGSIIKAGTGTLTLTNSNTYSGSTNITGGTIQLGITNGLPVTTALTIANSAGAIFDLNNKTQTIGSLSGGGISGGNITLGSGNLITGDATNTSYGGVINGTGTVIKQGSGTLTISGINTYSGGTNINGGTLQLAAVNTLPAGGSFINFNGGTLQTGSSTGYSQTGLGFLTLSDNSTIALGTGIHALNFAASNGAIWTSGKTLTITGWTGIAGSSGTAGKIFVGTDASGLTTAQLAEITFSGYSAGAQILSTGEVVPLCTPPTISSQPSATAQMTCQNGTAFTALSVTATGSGTLTYQWYSNTTQSNTGGTSLGSGATSSSYIPDNTTAGTLYYYVVVTNSGCFTTSNVSGAFNVSVLPTITTQPSTTDQNVCQGSAATALTVTTSGGTPGYQWYSNTTSSNSGGTAVSGATSTSYTPSTAAAGTLYYYVVVTNGSCTVTSNVSGAINVSASTTITMQPSTAAQNICQGSAATPLTVTTSSGTPTYQWYSNASNSNTSGTAVGTNSPSYTPLTTVAGTLYYYVVITSGTCTATSAVSGAVNVSVLPTITTQPSTAIQNICQGSLATALTVTTSGGTPTYQWYSNASNSNTGGTAVGTNSPSYTPSTAVAGTLYYYVVVTNGNCTVTSNVSGAVNVSASTTITSQPSTAVQNICQGSPATPLTVTTSGGTPTYQWYSNSTASNTGGTAVGTNSPSYTPLTTVAGTLYYYVVITSGTCTATSAVSGAVNVSVLPTITTQPSTAIQNICQGSLATALTVTTSGGTPTYQWYSNASNSNTGGTAVGTNSPSYTPSTAVAGTLYYYVVVTNGSCTVTSNVSGAVNVSASTTITSQPSTAVQNICQGSPATPLTVTTSGGTPTYQWYSNSTASNTGGTAVGTNSPSYTPLTTVAGTLYYYVVITSGTCTATSAVSGAVNVSVLPTITTQPSTAVQNICQGSMATALTVTTSGGTPTYQWYSNASNSNTGGTAVGTNSPSYTPSTAVAGTLYYYVVVTNGSCTVTSNVSGAITINANVTPTVSITANPMGSVCNGTTITFTSTVTNGGTTPTYQWQLNGSNISGATLSTYSSTTLNSGDQIDLVLTSNATCAMPATVTSNILTETITSSVTPSITIATTMNPSCPGSSVTFTSTTSGGGTTPTYQWQVNGANAPGASTNSSYTTSTLNTGDVVTCILSSSAPCAAPTSATSNAITETINPVTVITTNPAGATYCQNATATTLTVAATGSGTLTYQWYSNTVNNNTTGTAISGATTSSYLPSTTTAGTVYYYVTVTGTCGAPTSTTASVIVNATTIITTNPTGATYCQNATPTALTVAATGSGTLTYQWYSNTANNSTTGTAISGATTSSYIPSTTTAGTLYYYATVTGTCGAATSTTATVAVNATTTITLTSAAATTNQTVAQGSSINNITYLIGGGTGASTTGLPAGVTGVYSGGIYTISGSPTALGTFNYTITAAGSCGAPTATGTITVVCAIPIQDTAIIFPTVAANSMTISWTVGSGSGRIVIMNTVNNFTNPINSATLPTANTVYSGSGQQVIYNGNSNTVSVTGLTPSSTYWYRVYEYNFCGGNYVYDTAALAANNPSSKATTGALLVQSNFSSVLTPKYMASGTSTRLPIMFRATVTGLKPNTNYRYYTSGTVTSDIGSSSATTGAGNPVLINLTGTKYKYTTSVSLSTLSGYDSLTTDGSGNYTGWFGFVNTGNVRFTAGNNIYPAITLGDTTGKTLYRYALNDFTTVLAFSTSSGATNGSFFQSPTIATPQNLVALFDNTSASGKPLFIAPVEYIDTTIASEIPGYNISNGAWNAIIPNVNANGVRAIEQLSVTTGALIGCIATSSTGIWPTGMISTVNPTNGATVKIISGTDDPLATCAVYPSISVLQGATTYANPSTYTYSNTVVGTNNDVTFIIKNTGSAPLNISSIVVVGSAYSLQGTAPTTVAAGSSATFVVRFNPIAATTYTGSITIADDDPYNSSYVINLSGTGYNIPVVNVQQGATNYANNSTYTYNNTVVANNNDVTFTIQNNGGAVLNISGIVIGGAAYSLQGIAPTTIAANSSATIVVRFTPPSAGTFTGTITINSNDPSQGTYVVNLSGTGTSATITTSPITGSPFCVGATTSAPVNVMFTYTPVATFTGSTFTAQLSDASGSFVSPVNIGTISADGSGSQIISATIPAATANGSAYRIRVISNTPIVTGSDNGTNLTVTNQVTPSISITQNPTGNICSGTSITFTSTPINGGTTPAYQWQVNGINVSGATGNTYTTTTLANGNTVDVVMMSALTCVTATSVTSNILIETITAPSTVTLTSAAGTDNQTVAQSGVITNITYSIGGGGMGATVTGLPTGVNGTYSGGTFTISGSPSVTGTFKYIVTATGGCNNNPMDTGYITVNAQTIIIANNPPQVGIGNINVGSAKNALSTFEVTNNLAASTTFSTLTTPLTSIYQMTDIAGFKLYTNTVDTFSTATQLGTTQTSTSTGTGETLTFTFSQSIPTVTTYYYWLTADIAAGAQTGDAITASALNSSNFTFSGSPVTGSVSAAGKQVIIASAITPGTLAVLRIGNGSTAPSASSLPVNIYQYNTSITGQPGTLLTTLPFLPTSTPGANRALVQSVTATSEGALNLSANARLITFVGYNDTVNDANVAKPGNLSDDVIGKLDAFLNASTKTSLNRASTYNGNNFRSAVTVDGSSYWAAGPVSTGGIRYITDGAYSATGTQLNGLNSRVLNIYNGQLYVSSGSGSNTGVNTVGTGLPTSGSPSVTLLNSVNLGASAYSYVFLNTDPTSPIPNLLYVAGTNGSGTSGIYKYYSTNGGTTWSLAGSTLTSTSVFGITGTIDTTGKVILFATINNATNAKPNTLMKYIDNSAPSAPMSVIATSLASSGGFYTFGGVSFTPLANGDTTITTAGTLLSGIWRNITITSGASATLTDNVQILGSVLIKSGGTLDVGTYTISSYSPDFRSYFNVASGGTLITANPNGIFTTGLIGSIQTSVFDNTSTTGINCNRYFDPGANYVYNGVIAQQTGNGLPRVLTTGNLTINNTAGVNLNNPGQVLNGSLILTNGPLILPVSSNDTLGGLVSHTNGGITGNATSSFVFNGSGAKPLYFTPGNYYMKNITINSTASNVTLDDSLYITAGAATNTFGTVIANATFTTKGYLTLKSNQFGDAQVGNSSGSISGNAIVERYIPARRAWRFLAVPFSSSTQQIRDAWQEGVNNTDLSTNQNPLDGFGTHITYDNNPLHGFDVNTTLNPSLLTWVQGTGNWSTGAPYTNSTLITQYPAYFIFVRGSRKVNLNLGTSAPSFPTVLRVTGILNETGISSVSKNYTANSGDYLFVGNPYASTINILSSLNNFSGIDKTKFWVWDPAYAGSYGVGGYVTYSSGLMVPGGSTYSGGTYAQSGQAFFVQANATGTATTLFQQTDKNIAETNVFGGIEPPSQQTNNDNEDTKVFEGIKQPSSQQAAFYTNLMLPSGDSLIVIDGVATAFSKNNTSVDSKDAQKQWNIDENIALICKDKFLAIDFRPIPVLTDTLYYTLYLKQQPYALKIFTQNVPTGFPEAWLVDKYLNTKTALNTKEPLVYNFIPNSDTNSYRNRFMLVFKRTLKATPIATTMSSGGATAATLEGKVEIYPNPVITGGKAILKFSNMKTGNYNIVVSDLNGKALTQKTIYHRGGSENYELQLDAKWATGSYLVTITDIYHYSMKANLIIGK